MPWEVIGGLGSGGGGGNGVVIPSDWETEVGPNYESVGYGLPDQFAANTSGLIATNLAYESGLCEIVPLSELESSNLANDPAAKMMKTGLFSVRWEISFDIATDVSMAVQVGIGDLNWEVQYIQKPAGSILASGVFVAAVQPGMAISFNAPGLAGNATNFNAGMTIVPLLLPA